MPVTAICNATYEDPRQRTLFKNIMVLGALSVLMDIDPAVIEKLFGEQYKGKERLLEATCARCKAGRSFAPRTTCSPPRRCPGMGLKVRRADKVGDRIFVEGNAAAALGCVYGGATVCAWYPITPSSSVAEAFEKYCRKYRRPRDRRGALRHRAGRGRDRLHRHGHRRGWNGARAFTATSRPRRVADDRVHRPGLLRRDPGDHHQRAARRPLHRHAHAHPAGRPAQLRLRQSTATPST
jgi:2-oxoglutarate ferredoxin oxidoreductase subunit alpha